MSAMPAEIRPAEITQAEIIPAESEPAPVRLVAVRSAPRRSAPRQSGSRARSAGVRQRPAGVRSCSAVLRAEPVVALQPAPSAQPAPHERPHLTGRGRSALVAGAVIVATLLWFAVASAIQGPARALPPHAAGHAPVSQVVVQPGQTLWSIALQADPTADPRLVVQQIVSMNSLTGQNIVAGQHLRVPQG